MREFTLALGFLLPWLAAGQTAAFEVATVKPAHRDPGEQRWHSHIEPSPAGLAIRAHTLRDCIEWAWSLKDYQLSGPAWIDSELYDIEAKAPGREPPARLRLMLQTLLTERFRLATHREIRDLSVYSLAVLRNEPKLQQSHSGSFDAERLPGPGLRLSFQRASPAQLADFLSSLAAVGRPVLDATHLGGVYDFTLDLRAAAGPWGSEAERQTAPSVSTVLEEQLGLKLVPAKAPIPVVVVDRASRTPLAN
jgi:uncharacterized protein (TIGR03435 family)